MAGTRPRVAVVGAGPAGAFAAACLLRARGDAEIDLLERLPTPWGLLRAGVAPDHQEIKRLEQTFDRQTLRRGCRFLGNVEVGVDVSHSELMRHYQAVIYATGAQTDKSLGIPGEDLPGSWAATEFVAWYNGHPDYRELEFDLTARRAVVIGNGNVAADVARVLTLSTRELERTDIADHALEALRESRIEEVIVLGRRGPAQAAFTSAELRELGHLDGVDLRVEPGDVELDTVSQGWLAEEGTFTARKNVELLREFAAAPARAGARRRIALRFLRSPVEIRGSGTVAAVDVRRNRIVRAEDGTLRAQAADDAVETIDCGLVLRSVGYRAVPLPDVPFDERHYRAPQRARPGARARRRAAPGRLRRRLDQARSDRDPGHEQARCRGHREPPRRGPRRGRAAAASEARPGGDRRAAGRAQAGPGERRRLAGDRRPGARARPQRAAPAGQAGVARAVARRSAFLTRRSASSHSGSAPQPTRSPASDGDGQPVRRRRQRTDPARVLRARRVVGEVEVEHEPVALDTGSAPLIVSST